MDTANECTCVLLRVVSPEQKEHVTCTFRTSNPPTHSYGELSTASELQLKRLDTSIGYPYSYSNIAYFGEFRKHRAVLTRKCIVGMAMPDTCGETFECGRHEGAR